MRPSPLARALGLGLLSCLCISCSHAPKPAAATDVDLAAIDTKINPCADFYQYACGNWMAHNPIPDDQSRWGSFGQLGETNRQVLHKILDAAAAAPASPDPVANQVGAFYASCMNEAHINELGAAPLQPELQRIAAMKSKADLAAEAARMQVSGAGALFRFGSGPDARDSNSIIANADQGGLGLGSLDYYLKNDPHSVAVRAKYVAHVQTMLGLLGDPAGGTAEEAQTVLRIETALAKGSLTPVQRRNPALTYNKMSLAQFRSLAPNFDWTAYFAAAQAPQFATINVGAPGFFRALNAELASVPMADWQTYLRWHLVHDAATSLSQPFVDANFNFGAYLSGVKVNQPRWSRCVATTDRSLGEALGQLYVKVAFGGDAKKQMLAMVNELEASLGKDINGLAWMSDATKQQALVKLKAITNKIAYPDKWRDYSSVAVDRDNFYQNMDNVGAYNWKRSMSHIGKPADRTEFNMTPPTVNAQYNPARNDITFPAGILQPPFYSPTRDLASNFGGIGVVIGHEMTHGFDDEGRQYNATGNLRDWWTKADGAAFQLRAQCIVDQYARYSPVADVHLNGELTLGENGADNAGARIAYMAMEAALTPADRASIDGYTPEQRFFLGFANVFCENARPAYSQSAAKTDPHSPGKFRVEGVVTNMPEFAQAFHCSPSDAMTAGPKACRVW